MTYGHWLDHAQAALAEAAAAAGRDTAGGHADTAGVMAARRRTYLELRRLAGLISGVDAPEATTGHADLLVNAGRRMSKAGPGVILGAGCWAAAGPVTPSRPAPISALGRHLAEAATALSTAGDILASHLDPGRRPRTPEGAALRAGAGRTGGLADIASLAHAAVQVDRRLPRWLGRTDPTLRTVYRPVIDAAGWWTRSRYPTVLRQIAAHSDGTSVLRTLDVAPAGSRATQLRPITNLADITDVVDTSRAWLFGHAAQATVGQVAAAARLAIAICATAIRTPGAAADEVGASGNRWKAVVRTLGHVADLGGAVDSSIVDRCVAATGWLAGRIYGAQPIHPQWTDTVKALHGKLLGLADASHAAMLHAVVGGSVCVRSFSDETERGFERRGLIHHAAGRWQRASLDDASIEEVLDALRSVALANTGEDIPAGERQPAAVARAAFPAAMTMFATPARTITTSLLNHRDVRQTRSRPR
jgi:hypothetical protein